MVSLAGGCISGSVHEGTRAHLLFRDWQTEMPEQVVAALAVTEIELELIRECIFETAEL